MNKPHNILIIVLLLFSNNLMSADFSSCHVSEIVLSGNINAHVQLDCVISGLPSCAEAKSYFAFDKSTESGKQYLSLLMAAFAANMKVSGYVYKEENTCPSWQTNVALLSHLRVKK